MVIFHSYISLPEGKVSFRIKTWDDLGDLGRRLRLMWLTTSENMIPNKTQNDG